LAPAARRLLVPVPTRRSAGALLGAAGLLVLVVLRPRRVLVEGPSMEPALYRGDRLLVLRRSRPSAGDIVALQEPGSASRGGGGAGAGGGGPRLIVKRVVSVAGEEVVVWGDNRAASTDSRVFGPVDRRAIVGRAVYRYFPPHRTGLLF
jgi:signal peptidase I